MAMPNEIVGILPCPRPNSFIFSSSSLASEITVGRKNKRSGLAERIFWTSEVASASGGVNVSSTINCSPLAASKPSLIDFADAIDAPVLSVMIATVFGLLPEAASARFMICGKACRAWEAAVAEVWKTYLKPRSVIRSE
jgi:hypothetical protein